MVKFPAEPTTMEEARTFAMLKPSTVFRLACVSKNAGWHAIHTGAIPSVRLGPKTIRIPVPEWLATLDGSAARES